MGGRARLDRLAAKLPPRPTPEPAPLAFRADVPEPVRRYLDERITSLMPPDASARTRQAAIAAGRTLADEPPVADVFRAIVRAASWGRRAPTLPEIQSAVLTGAGVRLAALLEGREYRPPDPYREEMCHSGLVWEILFSDSGTFGGHTVYSLDGPALLAHWHRSGGTEDAETLALIGFGPAELALLAATG